MATLLKSSRKLCTCAHNLHKTHNTLQCPRSKPKANKCDVRILNASDEYITLYKNQTIGILRPIDAIITYDQENINQVRIDDESESDAIPETIPLDQQDQKFEIPARVLGDEKATKRYLKTLRRQIQDKKRKEKHLVWFT